MSHHTLLDIWFTKQTVLQKRCEFDPLKRWVNLSWTIMCFRQSNYLISKILFGQRSSEWLSLYWGQCNDRSHVKVRHGIWKERQIHYRSR
jgi:hypothetical protein